jgi:hypothetical protein
MHKLSIALALVLHLGCETPSDTAGKAPPPAPTPAPAKAAPAPAPVPAPASAPAAAPAPAAPAGKVVASYALDLPAMTKLYDAEIAKLPPKDRPAASMNADVLKRTEIKLTLNEGGKGEMATTKPAAEQRGAPQVTTEPLTWEQKGKDLVLTGPQELKRPMKCAKSGAAMTCVQEGGPTKLLFKRL